MTGASAPVTADAVFYALLLLLPLSALIARRVPIGTMARHVLAWIAIFAVVILLVSERERFAPVLARMSDVVNGRDQSVSGDTVRIAMADDGHFWAMADINGVRRRMLIDSGATTTAISAGSAAAAGLDLDESPFPALITTANGPISARQSTIKALTVGSIHATDLPVIVSPAFGEMDVIGMNFLSRLKSWRVEGRTLILEPRLSTSSDPQRNLT